MPHSFHPDELLLLQAVHANPRDDLPRLVYADWLDENDNSDCAEFICLQVAWYAVNKTHLPPTGKGITPAESRMRHLAVTHRRRWWRSLPPDIRHWTRLVPDPFRRGLPWLSLCLDHALSEVYRLPAGTPPLTDFLARLHRWLCPTYQLYLTVPVVPGADMRPLLDHPVFGRMSAVSFDHSTPSGDQLAAILASTRLKALTFVAFGSQDAELAGILERELAPHVPVIAGRRKLS